MQDDDDDDEDDDDNDDGQRMHRITSFFTLLTISNNES